MILTPDNEYAAVLDYTVLAPMLLCDLLLRCADEPAVFRALWSSVSLNDTHPVLINAGYQSEYADFRLRGLRDAFPEAEVNVPKKLIEGMPEAVAERDRHVVAAAVHEKAHVIVTVRVSDFPPAALEPHGIFVHHPDDFLVHQYHLCPGRIIEVIDAQASGIRVRRRDLLRRLSPSLPKFAGLLT